MIWTHLAIAGPTFDPIGAAVVSLAVFRVSVSAIHVEALSVRSEPKEINQRAKWLGEERAYARAGVGLIVIGIALQLASTSGAIHGSPEWVAAAVAVAVPFVVAAAVLRWLVPRWNREVSDERARPENTSPW